jgi:hypothetical protein
VADDLTPPVPAGGILLFSYGTLQQPDVQLATFGRRLGGERDANEVDDYTRVLVRLRSGRQAWVYALAGTGDGVRA